MSDAYRKIVREARDHWGTSAAEKVDWKSIDKGLFERIERDRGQQRARFSRGLSAPLRLALAGSLAVSVVAAVVAGKMHESSIALDSTAKPAIAGVIVGPDGRAWVNGAMLGRGAPLHSGDTIEARGRVIVEQPGHATFALEDGTVARITRAEAPLVLALERGAIEASVVPLAHGEAFALDVDEARVAVHGTHLRVARSGPDAVVDLNEGVVSLGPAPRVGNVLGTLIVAPAHAEFVATDAQGTLTVTHDAARVLAPASFAAPGEAALVGRVSPAPAAAPLPKPDSTALALAAVPPTGRGEPHAAAPPIAPPAASVAPPAPAVSDDRAKAALAAAVRHCMDERPAAENVTVLVETTLYLELNDDGTVRTARFEPPIAPDVNTCSTPAIYRARFAHGGSTSVVLTYASK